MTFVLVQRGAELCLKGGLPEGDKRDCLMMGAVVFDLIATIGLLTVGAMALGGKIPIPFNVSIGLLSGAGGIVFLYTASLCLKGKHLPYLGNCCQPREHPPNLGLRTR